MGGVQNCQNGENKRGLAARKRKVLPQKRPTGRATPDGGRKGYGEM